MLNGIYQVESCLLVSQCPGKMNIMKKQKRNFPYQIHLVLGLIWIVVGTIFYSGVESAVWVGGGLIMTVVGFLNRNNS